MKKKAYLIAVPVLASVFFFGNHFSCQRHDLSGVFGSSSSSPLKGSGKTVKAEEIQNTFREIFNLYRESVVFITTEQIVRVPSHPYFNDPFLKEFFGRRGRSRLQKRTGLGTGFVISKNGYICTNHHVISGVDKVFVNIHDKNFEARVIGSDERTDIALIKIKSKADLKPAYFGNSDSVMVGDWAVAIGNPFGLDRTFTVGVISAIGRSDVDMMGGSHIQTDASINPGNSGGPLINIYGEVIGINRMIYSKSGGYMGIGFAIPINTAQSILNQLKKYGKVKRGYFGITIIELNERYAKQLGLDSTEGTLVGEIISGSPAERGGIRVGDVILKLDGKKIKGYRDLLNKIGETPIGKRVKVSIWRDRRIVNLFVKVTERP
jgi:Do/DeqQ family serine protease